MKDSMSELVTTMRSSQMFSGAQLVGRDVRGSGWQNRRRALEQVLEEWRRSPGGAR